MGDNQDICRKQEFSGKSLEFVKQRIASGMCGDMKNNIYSDMFEVEFKKIVDMIECKTNITQRGNTWEHNYIGICDNGDKKEMEVIIECNTDAKFEYFTIESCLCDGTFIFYFEPCRRILGKMFMGTTYYKPKLPKNYENEMEKYVMKYTVGDFVFANEFGEEFATEDKPWMLSRFSVMLPIKCDFIKKEHMKTKKYRK